MRSESEATFIRLCTLGSEFSCARVCEVDLALRVCICTMPCWRARRRKRRVRGAWGPKSSGTRRRTASHCAFAKMRPRRGDFRASASNLPCFGALAVESGAYLTRGDSNERGMAADCLALRIRENAPSTWRFSTWRFSTRRILPVLARSQSKAARIWRVGTQAERGTAADCLALRIRLTSRALSHQTRGHLGKPETGQ
jgi:hypothetical protein